jgi:hypothetical protein
MDWLLALLQEAMTGVMAGEATPLQKANAVARLTALYLKASHVAELEQGNAALAERAAAAEAYTAELEARATAWAVRLEEAAATAPAPDGMSEAGADIRVSAPPTESGLFSLARAQASLLGGPIDSASGDTRDGPQPNGRRPEAISAARRAPP